MTSSPIPSFLSNTTDPIGNQIYPNGTSPNVQINYDDDITNLNVGLYLPVTLGNKVWEDINGNGIQDDDERGVDGLEVTLLNAASGDEVDTTLTAADGSFWFDGLPPGEYAVQYELPPDFVFALAPSNDLLGKASMYILVYFILFLYSFNSPSFFIQLFQHHLIQTHKQTML